MIPRIQKDRIKAQLVSSKIIVVRGPKNVGKRDLILEAILELNKSVLEINCDVKSNRNSIETTIHEIPSETDIILLTEAQHLEQLQSFVELALSDQLKQTIVIHCSFNPQLDETLLEVLSIEGMDIKVFAPSFYEAAQFFGLPQEEKLLEERLVFGNYPAVLNDLENAPVILQELVKGVTDTHLGINDRINKGDKLLRVMQLLAFSIGEPISYNEIGERCQIDNETVERYISLLEDALVLIKLPAFHSEKRYELKKAHCIYFQDNGIRNALIQNFNSTNLRNDMPQLWSNYVISERVKWLRMNDLSKTTFFWRTHTRQQVDFVEVGENVMGYKMDWEKRKKVKIPAMFSELYPQAKTILLNRSSYWNFLSRKN